MTREEAIATEVVKMTREEVIEIITNCMNKAMAISSYNSRFINALHMAIKALEEESGDCFTCKHKTKDVNEEPCVKCCYNYHCMFEPKPKTKELSETEIQEAFKEKFQDRRAISLDEIERVIRGLFE